MATIPKPEKEWYSMESIKQMSPEVIRSIINADISEEKLKLQIAYEILNLSRFARFPTAQQEQTFFGTFYNRQYNQVDLNFLLANLQKFTSYQLMTLMETDEDLYKKLSNYISRAYFLVNITAKEFVILGNVDNSVRGLFSTDSHKERIIQNSLKHWNKSDNIKIKIKPYNYRKRDFTDKTEDFTKYMYDDEAGDDVINLDVTVSVQEDEWSAAKKRERFEITQRMLSRYPLIDKYKSLPVFLLVETNYLVPILFNSQQIPQLRYEKRSRIAWRPELLNNLSDPTNSELPFYEILADLFDYLGSRNHVNVN